MSTSLGLKAMALLAFVMASTALIIQTEPSGTGQSPHQLTLSDAQHASDLNRTQGA